MPLRPLLYALPELLPPPLAETRRDDEVDVVSRDVGGGWAVNAGAGYPSCGAFEALADRRGRSMTTR